MKTTEFWIGKFQHYSVPDSFKSDGCTGAPDKLPSIRWKFPPEIYWTDITEACVRHDYLRSTDHVSVQVADKILKRNMQQLGVRGWWPHIYWTSVKWARKWYA